MTDTDTQALNLKTILLLIVVAIVVAVVVTLIQTLILGKANVAITGGSNAQFFALRRNRTTERC